MITESYYLRRTFGSRHLREGAIPNKVTWTPVKAVIGSEAGSSGRARQALMAAVRVTKHNAGTHVTVVE